MSATHNQPGEILWPHLDLDEVRKHWGLLNHDGLGCTEVVAIDGSGSLTTGFFDNLEGLIASLQPHISRHIYVGSNACPAAWTTNCINGSKRPSDSDIEVVSSIVLDIDPIDRKPGELGSEEAHLAALEVAGQIARDYSGAVIDSGGGAYCWFCVEPISVAELGGAEQFKSQVDEWQRRLEEQYDLPGQRLKIDATQALSHVYRLAGTYNHKTPGRPSRVVKLPSELAVKGLEEILAIEVAETASAEEIAFPVDALPERFEQLKASDKKLQELFGGPAPDGDQSKRDVALACGCLKKGLSEEETATVVWSMPHGKRQREASEGKPLSRQRKYVLDTVSWAAKELTQGDEEPEPPVSAPDPAAIPIERILPTEGWLADYIEYGAETTEAPKQYHLAAGLSILAATVGRRVFTPWGDERLYPNLYIAIVGVQGRPRKSTAVSGASNLLSAVFPSKLVHKGGKEDGEGWDEIRLGVIVPCDGSVEGIMDGLKQNPSGIIIERELSHLLAIAERGYNTGLKQLLADCYDAPAEILRVFSGGKVRRIERPAPTILGASTLVWLIQQIDDAGLEGGLLSRFTYFFADRAGELKPIRPQADQLKLNSLKRYVKDLRAELEKNPREMRFAPDALSAYEKLYRRIEGGPTPDEPALQGFLTRLMVSSIKMAMLLELSLDPKSDTIHMRAWQLAEAITEYLLQGATSFVSEAAGDVYARERKKVLGIIRAKPGIKRGNLLKNSHLSADQLTKALITLKESGLVREAKKPSPSGPAALTYWPT